MMAVLTVTSMSVTVCRSSAALGSTRCRGDRWDLPRCEWALPWLFPPPQMVASPFCGCPWASATNLLCINGPGAMAGSFQAADGIHGVFTDGITWTRIDVPGGTQTMVWGLNDHQLMSGLAMELR